MSFLPHRACEFGPLVWSMALLWLKVVVFSVSLRSVWWAPDTSLVQWLVTHADVLNTTLATLLLVLAPAMILPRTWRFIAVLLLNFIITTLIVANSVHFRLYGNIMPLSQASSVGNLTYILPSIIRLLSSTDTIYYVDVIAGIFFIPSYQASCCQVPPLERKRRLLICCRLMLLGILVATPTFRLLAYGKMLLSAYTNLQREVAATVGLLPYYFGVGLIYVKSRLYPIGPAERQRVLSFMSRRHSTNDANRSNLYGIARGRNVIMIMAESLQRFSIDLKINGQLVAPRISAFARESINYVNFYDQTYLATTSDGEFTSLQSLHPLPAGSVGGRYPHHRFYALPTLLSERGYATLSASGESGAMWYMDKIHPRLGFQQSFFEQHYQIHERIGRWMADRDFFLQTIPLLKAHTQPFFAYLVTSSSHHPFDVPQKYHALNLGEYQETELGNYLHSVHYFDQVFGEFIDHLRENGLLEKSLVVLYGDHQAYLNGASLAGLLGTGKLSGYDSFRVRKGVPVIIRLPQGMHAGPKGVVGGHLDIAPTILSLIGIDDEVVMFGNDLTKGIDSLVVFRDGSFNDGTHLFINGFGVSSVLRCYETNSGSQIDCGHLEDRRRSATEQLEISDLYYSE